jgi:lipoyl(octanoyl) transferase
LQDVTRRFLQDYGIQCKPMGPEPGLYTGQGKIVFFGIRIKNGMSSHGLAINVSNDLLDFRMIRSCGRATETFSKMSDFGAPPSTEMLFQNWFHYFRTGLCLTQDLIRPMVNNQFNLRL